MRDPIRVSRDRCLRRALIRGGIASEHTQELDQGSDIGVANLREGRHPTLCPIAHNAEKFGVGAVKRAGRGNERWTFVPTLGIGAVTPRAILHVSLYTLDRFASLGVPIAQHHPENDQRAEEQQWRSPVSHSCAHTPQAEVTSYYS